MVNSEKDSEFIRILIIEDNQDSAQLIQEELIENNGNIRFKPELAECLSTGIEHINNRGADVILLDVTLPDMQDIDTLIELKKNVPDIPIIVYSNHDDESFAVKAIQEGAQDYLVKGSVEKRLTRTYHSILHRTAPNVKENETNPGRIETICSL